MDSSINEWRRRLGCFVKNGSGHIKHCNLSCRYCLSDVALSFVGTIFFEDLLILVTGFSDWHSASALRTRSQAVARIADRTATQQTLVISDCC